MILSEEEDFRADLSWFETQKNRKTSNIPQENDNNNKLERLRKGRNAHFKSFSQRF